MTTKVKSILIRLLKGTLSGVVGAMSIMTVSQPAMWSDFPVFFQNLLISGAYGAVTGLILAVQKWLTWDETPE